VLGVDAAGQLPAAVGAGASATVRSRLPATSVRSSSRSDMKSSPTSITSRNDVTSSLPLTPRRRCLIGPMWLSNASVTPPWGCPERRGGGCSRDVTRPA
jgi:hypothetical protein